MTLKDALALVKLPDVAWQSVRMRLLAVLADDSPELKIAMDRLISQVPQHAKAGWRYCHSVMRGSRWVHEFERQMANGADWTKTMRCLCADAAFDEIIVIVGYTAQDMLPRARAVRFWPQQGVVHICHGGTPDYRAAAERVFRLQSRRVRRASEGLGDSL